ncbi:MAG: 30S ribosomal protein S9 [Candidatus Schekmanbacteria bacterium]|nr:30S ribosomal protein S9 [Candidatus Schekmanbacteria bacterium]
MGKRVRYNAPVDEPISHGDGGRKTAVARVWMRPGNGKVMINNRPIEVYFGRDTLRTRVKQPLELVGLLTHFDIRVRVAGGGTSGQADAIRHGITNALLDYNDELRKELKRAGLITRDAREKERKKYGQRGARARFQFSKR